MTDREAVYSSALFFLQQVQETLPESYEHLMDCLSDFRARRISCSEVQDAVIQLLRSDRRLLIGFSQFLPLTEREKYDNRIAALPDAKLAYLKRKRDIDYNESRLLSGQHQYQQQLKFSIPIKHLQASWREVCSRVKRVSDRILAEPETWIPVVDIADICRDTVPLATIERIKEAGVVKIRQTVTEEEATRWNQRLMLELKEYLGVDTSSSSSYDKLYEDAVPKALEFGGVQHIFYSPAQFEARTHPNMVAARKWLNRTLWKYKDEDEFIFVPDQELIYADRFRNRLASYGKQPGMKDHIDNGSLSHWADPSWQRVYSKIWSGLLDDYDPWDSKHRTDVAGLPFRSFQGWLALTKQGTGDGTLEVVPMLKEAMEYILLRPLLADVPAHLFPGARDQGLGDSIEVSSRWHSPLLQAKISIGTTLPGDTVWWHPDITHCVEAEHNGSSASNVMYIPAFPLCPTNARYVGKQAVAFRNGAPPPDFVNAYFVEDNSKIRATEDDLSAEAKQMMGLAPFSTQLGRNAQQMVEECNEIVRSLRDSTTL